LISDDVTHIRTESHINYHHMLMSFPDTCAKITDQMSMHSEITHIPARMREPPWERGCVCVCVRERERAFVYVCVWERERPIKDK